MYKFWKDDTSQAVLFLLDTSLLNMFSNPLPIHISRLKGFAGHKTVEMEAVRQAKVDARAQADQQANSPNSKVLEVMEAYRPNGSSASLFENTNRSKDGYYTLQELRALLAEYFKEKNLADPKNQRIIKLDEPLREALLKKGENVDRIPRDQTSER